MNATMNDTWGALNSTVEDTLSPDLWGDDLLILPNATGLNLTGNTTQSISNDPRDSPSVAFASAFFMLFCFSMCLRSPPDEQRRALIARNRENRLREMTELNETKRKKMIESSLTTKRVISCDDNKTLRLGDVGGSLSLEDSVSINSLEDEQTSECVICLDAFRKGDIVTWAKSMGCQHVFHHECLQHWLENPKHDDCPYCRCQIIDDSMKEGTDADSIDADMDHSSSSLAFVIMDGLVSPLRRRCSLVGSSINLDDGGSVGSQGVLSLRRGLSFGADTNNERPPSMLSVALRRVSSGIYTRLGGTFDEGDAEEGRQPASDQLSSIELRRTKSEGLPVTPTIRNTAFFEGTSDCDPAPTLDLDLDISEMSEDIDHAASRPRIMRLGFRQTSGIYSKLTFDSSNGAMEDDSDEEDGIGPRTLWLDEALSDEEDDLEAGMLELPTRD